MEEYLRAFKGWMWRYECCPSSYAGLHFTATPESCRLLIELIADLKRDHRRPALRSFPLRVLNQKCASYVAWGNPGEYVCYSKAHLELVRASPVLRQMDAGVERDGLVRLTFSELYIDEFAAAVLQVSKDDGDFALCPTYRHQSSRGRDRIAGKRDRESLEIWFCPCFGHERVAYRPRPEDLV